ncbi:type 2 lanthipeptide synthetase LanM family protein [Streptomyces sp. NBC_00448]|uniref:type 2 lanthipeptide synthetase LanM family protein n=1 Tax=Streptomyces sp. NBC_00448 TaxID=2903652 RepID=UPI002E1D98CD
MPSEVETSTERVLAMPWERCDRPALTGGWWARALRLDERCGAGCPDTEPAEDDDATVVAGIRWERWRGTFSHVPEDVFERQMADYGCTPDGLRKLLAEAPDLLGRRVDKPVWAADVERLVAAMPVHPTALPEAAREGGWYRGFALIVDPFVHEALRLFDELSSGIDGSGMVDLDAFREEVRQGAARRLVRLASRVLVLELHVLRVTGRLDGDSPEDRFWSFVRHYRHRDALDGLLDEYAVLARLLITTAGQVAQAYAEFLHRFARDRADLVRHLFGGVDPGTLAVVELTRGDTHDRGRSVGIARFTSGWQVVYKPRALGIHRCFNEVLDWYNQRVPQAMRLRTLLLVDREDYGWVEFVDSAPCEDSDGATRYFRRQGALLAVLYSLGGVDFHFENLIAVGDQPVPVDLEALFCADLPRSLGSDVAERDPATTAYVEAVSRVGLLPSVLVGEDGQAFDIGGMGGDRDAVIPFRVVDWEGAGTDEMSLTRVQPRLGSTHNRPSLDGADLDVTQYTTPLLDGFREGYRVVAAGRPELTGSDGLFSGFFAEQVRIIPRATREYAVLLNETTHPDALRDALDRDEIFGALWARSAADPRRTRLVRHEVEDLWSGDVPLFTAAVGSCDVRAGDGALVEGLLPESGIDRVERVLTAMDDQHLARQEWIVSAHLVTRTAGTDLTGADAVRETAPAGRALPERALAAAKAVADQLEASAYRNGGHVGWLGLDLVRETRWQVTPLSMDLYNGYPGIALFLAQLAHVTGEHRYAELARGVLGPITDFAGEQLKRAGRPTPAPAASVGAFSGLTGMALVLASSAALLDDADLDKPVVPLLEYVADQISQDDGFDVISGAAGCLAVAEALSATFGAVPHRLAQRCVDVLQAGVIPAGRGVGWSVMGERPLLGFSHGASGIAWALWSYAKRTGDAEARRTALRALAYEHGEFDERMGNWPDYREEESADQYTWCHGAPGVGLARAAMLATEPGSEELVRDVRHALAATERFGLYRSHCICHGELGNLELFAAAAQTLSDEKARLVWRERATAVVAQVEQGGPVCGTPSGIETPGLMSGLAGIGHGLLRIAAPEQVPPILLLTPSRRT